LGVKRVDDPRDFGVAEIGEDGFIFQGGGKATNSPSQIWPWWESIVLRRLPCYSNVSITNIRNQVKNRGEFSITDALEHMIEKGALFKSFKVSNWFDCGKKDTLLISNATLLKKFGGIISPEHSFENTIVIPPVSIANGCDIKNSIIGANVTIGEPNDD
jgi:glucose-1-phosphate thymidylyltransferase